MKHTVQLYDVIKHVVMTEKSSALSAAGVVTVVVDRRCNKDLIKSAFEKMYGAAVSSVRIINTPEKRRSVRGKVGVRSGVKKALIGIGVGNTINFNKMS